MANFEVTIERAACEACSGTWNSLIDLAGRRTVLMQTDF
jgi:hypothetical protein